MTKAELDFFANFNLNIEVEGRVYGFVTWFDCLFSHGTKKITLSTSPYKKQTHWKQTVFYVDHPFNVKEGDVINGGLNVVKATSNPRELNVTVEYKHN